MSRIDELLARADELDAEGMRLHEQASGRFARFEGGQPIILRHHSTKGARRDRDAADSLERRATQAWEEAEALRSRARSLKAQEEYRRHLETADVYTRSDIDPGDIVWTLTGKRRIPHRVVRVNAKSVSVETGYSWVDRIAYDDIIDVTKCDEGAA